MAVAVQDPSESRSSQMNLSSELLPGLSGVGGRDHQFMTILAIVLFFFNMGQNS